MESIFTRAARFLREQRLSRRWRNIVGVLAGLVVFCTTYALILPAMTAERQTVCGMEEHTHTEECFENGVQMCGKEEHTHTEDCYARGQGITVGVIMGPQGNSVTDVPPEQGNEEEPSGGELEVDLSGDGTAAPEEGTQLTPEQQEQEVQALEAQRQEEQNQLDQRLSEVTLTGTWADDVVAAAKAHTGCLEDGRSLVDAALQFSGVEGIPQASDGAGGYTGYADWVAQIRAAGRYKDSSKIPKEGDVVFLDQDADAGTLGYEDDRIDHAGIVIRVDAEKTTVEATGEKVKMLKAIMVLTDNAEGRIESFYYSMEDPTNINRIAGYARIPKNPSQGEAEEPDEENHTGGAPEQETVPAETEQQTEAQQPETMTESQTGEQPEAVEGQTEAQETETAEGQIDIQSETVADDQTGEQPEMAEGQTEAQQPETMTESQTGEQPEAVEGQTDTQQTEAMAENPENETEAAVGMTPEGTEAETDTLEEPSQADAEEPETDTETEMSTDEDMEPETDTEMSTDSDTESGLQETEMPTNEDIETENDTEMSTNDGIESETGEPETETDTEILTGEEETETDTDTESFTEEPETDTETDMSTDEDTETEIDTEMSTDEDIEPETGEWNWSEEDLEDETGTEAETDGWDWSEEDLEDETGTEAETGEWNWSEEDLEDETGTEAETGGWDWSQEDLEDETGTEAETGDWNWSGEDLEDETGTEAETGEWDWSEEDLEDETEAETGEWDWSWEDLEDETETEWDEWDHLEDETETEAEGSDPEADLETDEDWEAATAGTELTGMWGDDLTAVALTQLGVKESTENFILDENGEQKGITRYGQWYGEPYGDWDAMFVSFCLNYAEVPRTSVPRAGSCGALAGMLQTYGLYESPAEYEATKGDLVFLDTDADGAADHVGILEGTTETGVGGISVIAGDMEDEVKSVVYAKGDAAVIGYGRLPQKPSQTVHNKVFNDGKVRVTAEYTAEAGIPENAKLVAVEVPQDDERYKERFEAVREIMEEENRKAEETETEEEGIQAVSLEDETEGAEETELETEEELYMRVYNIGFYVDEQEVEPQAEVKISIEFLDDPGFGAGANRVIHMAEGKEPESLTVTNTAEEVSGQEGQQTINRIEFSTKIF